MTLKTGWFREHAEEYRALGAGSLHFDELMSKHTYYRIGGPADVFATPASLEQLEWIKEGIQKTGAPFFILGAGSNLLVSDRGFRGIVIHTSRLNPEVRALPRESLLIDTGAKTGAPVVVRTGASVSIPGLIRRAMQDGWGGFEFLCGIPGTVGGAITMNAGTHLGDCASRVLRVEVVAMDSLAGTSTRSFEGPELRFGYRANHFIPENSLIWSVNWAVETREIEKVRKELQETLDRRKQTQPVDWPSCGSVFKNPQTIKAWQVMNQIGLRGQRVGNAQVSVKHSNFIVNLGGATATDVWSLIQLAQTRAREQLGVTLELEVETVGDFSTP